RPPAHSASARLRTGATEPVLEYRSECGTAQVEPARFPVEQVGARTFRAAREAPLATKYEIISADSHVNPLPSMWAEYLPARFRDRAPVVEHTDEGDAFVFEGKRTLSRAISAAAGKKAEEKPLRGRIDDGPAGGWDPQERLKAGDVDGVDAEV